MAKHFKVAGYKLVGGVESTMPRTREGLIDLQVGALTRGMRDTELKRHLKEAVIKNLDSKRDSLLVETD